MISVDKGAAIIADLMEKKVKSSTVPVYPWNIIGLVMKILPAGVIANLKILKKSDIKNLLICDAMSHMCIDATTRAAFDLGFTCRVAEDACATRDLVFKGRTLKALEVHGSFMAALSGLYAEVVITGEIINQA